MAQPKWHIKLTITFVLFFNATFEDNDAYLELCNPMTAKQLEKMLCEEQLKGQGLFRKSASFGLLGSTLVYTQYLSELNHHILYQSYSMGCRHFTVLWLEIALISVKCLYQQNFHACSFLFCYFQDLEFKKISYSVFWFMQNNFYVEPWVKHFMSFA